MTNTDPSLQMPWTPTTIRRADQPYDTATETVRVQTDVGPGYLKALGNRGSPHYLAADLVGTQLAAWMGLPTFDHAIVMVTDGDEITLFRSGKALPGPAFITREESGTVWGGDEKTLEAVVSPADIARLVLFDTWTRNCDRHPPDGADRGPNYNNVFLSNEGLQPGELRLIAMDHTHCFAWGRDWSEKLGHIDTVQDERIYGLFPPFSPYLEQHRAELEADLQRIGNLQRNEIDRMVQTIPQEWSVEAKARAALVDLLCRRGAFLAEEFVRLAFNELI